MPDRDFSRRESPFERASCFHSSANGKVAQPRYYETTAKLSSSLVIPISRTVENPLQRTDTRFGTHALAHFANDRFRKRGFQRSNLLDDRFFVPHANVLRLVHRCLSGSARWTRTTDLRLMRPPS